MCRRRRRTRCQCSGRRRQGLLQALVSSQGGMLAEAAPAACPCLGFAPILPTVDLPNPVEMAAPASGQAAGPIVGQAASPTTGQAAGRTAGRAAGPTPGETADPI